MEIKVHDDIQELLMLLKSKGNAVIYGGYIRDLLIGRFADDVDVITNISADALQEMFPQAKRRTTVNGHDVLSFKLEGREKHFIEITVTDEDLIEKSKRGDFTINSLVYDGEKVIDLVGGISDFEKGILREVDLELFKADLLERPFLWLKVFRLLSLTDFSLSVNIKEELSKTKDTIKGINPNIIQSAGFKTLLGKNPVKALQLLSELGVVSSFTTSEKAYSLEEKSSVTNYFRLSLLAALTSKQAVDEYLSFYYMPPSLVAQFNELYGHYANETQPKSQSLKNQLFELKRELSV